METLWFLGHQTGFCPSLCPVRVLPHVVSLGGGGGGYWNIVLHRGEVPVSPLLQQDTLLGEDTHPTPEPVTLLGLVIAYPAL